MNAIYCWDLGASDFPPYQRFFFEDCFDTTAVQHQHYSGPHLPVWEGGPMCDQLCTVISHVRIEDLTRCFVSARNMTVTSNAMVVQ